MARLHGAPTTEEVIGKMPLVVPLMLWGMFTWWELLPVLLILPRPARIKRRMLEVEGLLF